MKEDRLFIRISGKEKQIIKAAARKEKKTISDYIRSLLQKHIPALRG